MMNFDEKTENVISEIIFSINNYLKEEDIFCVREAMNYSISAGGKRIRPLMLLAANEAFGGSREEALPFAAAIEMIHTYSLIHDDLPAMDDDDYRRGRLSCHKKYNEAVAVLAGDALLNKAYELMLAGCKGENGIEAAKIIAKAAGIEGMVGGQAADIYWSESSLKSPGEAELLYINERKTAALISAALEAGAALAGASKKDRDKLWQIGKNIGIAFQIMDDVLDYEGDFKNTGKLTKSDEKNNKSTYVTILGAEECRKRVKLLSEESMDMLKSMEADTAYLQEITRKLVNRNS